MKTLRFVLTIIAPLSLFLLIAGCNTEQPAQQAEAPEQFAELAEHNAEVEAALAELPPEDRKLAEEQKLCPVSLEPLGSMGKPIRVELGEQDLLVCCEGCVDMVKEDPERYIAKLQEARGE